MEASCRILYKGILFLLSWLLVGGSIVMAQNGYTLVGSALPGSAADCYDLTEDNRSQHGAVWYDKPLNLSQSFELEFTINFGDNPLGADGVVMVMQTQGNRALGEAAGGIGFRGLQPSLGIEFDTNQNLELYDPAEDHMAIVRDGISDHKRSTEFAPPVPISTTSENVKDGRDYLIKVKWNAATQLLQVSVNCVLRISQSINLVSTIFNGTQQVYWGFTASTGARSNRHRVCLQKDVVARDTFRVCKLEELTLVSGLSFTNQYEWQPALGLDNPRSRTPRLTATTNQLYTVRYVDRCSLPKIDSVFVQIKSLPALTLGGNRDVCENNVVELTPTLTPANRNVQFRWSTGDTTRQLKPVSSDMYVLQITAEGCSTSDSAFVTFQTCLPWAQLFIPEAFTPNGDGINDVFEWKSDQDIEARMMVFNRWGETVFSSDNSKEFWDGTLQKQACPSSMYTWRIEYRDRQSKDSKRFVKRGDVFLLR